MGKDREFKIKGSFDVSDVERQADTVVRKMDQVAVAAQRAARNVGLATDPAAFFAEAEAGKKSYSTVSNRTGPQLVAATENAVNRLEQAQARIRPLSHLLGLGNLGGELANAANLIRGIASLGPAAIVGGLGIAVAGGAAAYLYYQDKERRRLDSETFKSQVNTNDISLNKLHAMVVQAKKEGTIRGGDAENIDQQIQILLGQNGIAAKGNSISSGIISRNIQDQQKDLLRQMREAVSQSYEEEEGAALKHAAVLSEISKMQMETEKTQLRQKLEAGLISNDFYAARLRGIAEEEAAAQKEVLDLQEQQLNARLERAKNDYEESAKIRNQIAGVNDARSLIDARTGATQEGIEVDRLSRNGRPRPYYRMQGDELSRIGLFLGGAGDSLPELTKQQLQELKQVNVLLRQLPSQIGPAL